MTNNKNLSLIKILFYALLTTSLISILFVALFSIFSDYKVLEKSSEETFVKFIEQEKDGLKSTADKLENIVNSSYKNLIRFLSDSAKYQLDSSSRIAKETFKQSSNVSSAEQISKEFQEKLELKNRIGKYSVYTLDGKAIMSPFDFSNEDIKKLIQDPVGNSNKEYTLNNKSKVISAANIIKELNIIVLYSYDVERIKAEFMQNISNIIQSIKTSKKEYIYLFDKNTQKLLVSNFIQNGNDEKTDFFNHIIDHFEDAIMQIVNNNEHGGFLQQIYTPRNSNENSTALLYMRDFNNFDLIIGAGIFTDDLNAKVKAQQEKLHNAFINKNLIYLVYLVFVLVIIFVITSIARINFENSFNRFIQYFAKAHNKNEMIPLEKLNFSEFKILAENMNQTIALKNEREKEKEKNLNFLNQYKNAVDLSSILSKTDKYGNITYVNDAFCNLSGFSKEEIIGKTHSVVRHPDVCSQLYEEVWSTIKKHESWHGIFKNLSKLKDEYYIKTTIIPILNANGEISEYIGIGNDVTDLINQSKQIQANLQDGLTKLPSRSALVEDINKNLSTAIIATFDISKFKHINEYYGFSIADELLIEISNIVEKLITNKNLKLYKLDSDKFALFGSKQDWNSRELAKFCLEISSYFAQKPIYIKDNKFNIDFSFGVSDEADFFITSEMAKDYAKASKSKVVVFSDKKDILLKNVNMTQALKKAIDEDRITIFKQPIIDNKTKKIAKYECLVRMIDEEGRIVPPSMFLDIAKSSNLYQKLTKIIIEKTFKYFSKNEDNFSLNLAIEDILSRDLINFLKERLARYPNIAHRLTLEVVEDEGIENFDEIVNFIKDIKKNGVGIAIDDFGSGYSNFEYLVKLNADTVKIDGSLIKNIDKNKEMLEVVKLIVEFAKKIGLKTIAEFVSSKEIADIVDGLDIASSQGFYYAQPKPLESE